MNCKRFEKLIPLYVEGDLEADELRNVATHVHGCHSCARLASQYNASQAWLHSFTLPEFDEAFYADLKQQVMQEINSRAPRPSLFQWLTWRWKPAYALAFLLLILFGATLLYLQSSKQSTTPNTPTAKQEEKQQQTERKNEPQEEQAPQPELKTPESLPEQAINTKPHSLPRHRVSEPNVTLPPNNLEPIVDSQISLKDRDGINAEEMSEMGFYFSSEAMTRIEFQTSDPNIRIIWFAPKTVELPKTMTE